MICDFYTVFKRSLMKSEKEHCIWEVLSVQSSVGLQNQVITKTYHTSLIGFGNNMSSEVPKSSVNSSCFCSLLHFRKEKLEDVLFFKWCVSIVIGLYEFTHIYISVYINVTLRVCLLEIVLMKINRKMCQNVSMCGQSIGNNFLSLSRLENATSFFWSVEKFPQVHAERLCYFNFCYYLLMHLC